MTPIQSCILDKNKNVNPIWIMRQAGRYLPEFRKIRADNKNFIELCLNKKLVPTITLQPLKRFHLDAAIIFSDILMIPFGLGQEVKFKKDFGPNLSSIDLNNTLKINSNQFLNTLKPIYDSIEITAKDNLMNNKDLIGFVGAPWTLLVYMINKISPKNGLNKDFFKEKNYFKDFFKIIKTFTKLHILNQIKSGATMIQIFDSWAGLVKEENLEEYIYSPTKEIVDYVKSLNTPVICFPKGIKNYKKFTKYTNPDVISIDYETDPKKILNDINIPIQGGLDPKILLSDKNQIKKEVLKYKNIFKDHPYIFNLGHGVLPETDPNMVEYLVNFVKNN